MPDLARLEPSVPVLLQGNEAIARGALEAGVGFAAGYPGNPSSEILESLADSTPPLALHAEWSVNEKVALESAAAASFSGLRSMASMKQNGVNVAQDFICNLTLSGTGRGGMLLVACDDPSGISSSNEQDSRFIARLADLPLLEPSSVQEALLMTKFAFEVSEALRNLVVLRSVSRLSHTRSAVVCGPLPGQREKPAWKAGQAFFTIPVVARHRVMKDKLTRAAEILASSGFNRYEGSDRPALLVVASGSCRLYAKEALQILGAEKKVGILHLGATWPLDEPILKACLAKTDRILFLEEVDAFVENSVKAFYAQNAPELGIKRFFGRDSGDVPLVGEMTPDLAMAAISRCLDLEAPWVASGYKVRAREVAKRLLPTREYGFCPGCPHRASYWSIKQALALDGRQAVLNGDIGCYTLGVLSTGFRQVRSAHCMGSGLGVASGLGQLGELGFEQPVLAVVGDSTFYHAALPALINARWNQSDVLLIVLDNSATAMTGFQPHPGTGMVAGGGDGRKVDIVGICQGLGIPCQVVDPYDLHATQAALHESLEEQGLRVLIFKRLCALVQGRQGGHGLDMKVNERLCKGGECGCNRYCTRVFRCPGLVFDSAGGAARIDPVTCVGCGVCAMICPVGAISAKDKEGAA